MKTPLGGVPGGVVVDEAAAWWSACRGGGFLADGGAGGGFVDDGLAGGVGGEQGGDGEPVDGAGQAAGLAVDGADGVSSDLPREGRRWVMDAGWFSEIRKVDTAASPAANAPERIGRLLPP